MMYGFSEILKYSMGALETSIQREWGFVDRTEKNIEQDNPTNSVKVPVCGPATRKAEKSHKRVVGIEPTRAEGGSNVNPITLTNRSTKMKRGSAEEKSARGRIATSQRRKGLAVSSKDTKEGGRGEGRPCRQINRERRDGASNRKQAGSQAKTPR